MKIEKISDTQIRCTLNRADLLSREIKISELAYGTEKAKTLFHDMIEQASHQFGFEADDLPLMIEAIPVSPDCIVLIITKVDDPEELDTRFSRFAPSEDEESPAIDSQDMDDMLDELFEPLDGKSDSISDSDKLDLPDNFIPMSDTVPDITTKDSTESTEEETKASEPEVPVEITRMFSFPSWSLASDASAATDPTFPGQSNLYKDDDKGIYLLTVTGMSDATNALFRVCNTLSEYGKREKYSLGIQGYITEHCRLISRGSALEVLREF